MASMQRTALMAVLLLSWAPAVVQGFLAAPGGILPTRKSAQGSSARLTTARGCPSRAGNSCRSRLHVGMQLQDANVEAPMVLPEGLYRLNADMRVAVSQSSRN
jgi:hypothetical protein